ncbi:MAG: hypothetical protein ACRCUT_14055, partial [Spirochaetota bacterium]
MPVLKKYHYPELSQRRFVFFNAALTSFLIGWIVSGLLMSLSGIFPSSPVFAYIMTVFLAAHLAGTFAGRLLFSKIKIRRLVYIVTELSFIAVCTLYAARNFILTGSDPFVRSYMYSPALFAAGLCLIPFFCGIKSSYFLKISCGIFFDEKKGALGFVLLVFAGLAAGITCGLIQQITGFPAVCTASPCVLLLLFLFLIKADYNPVAFYAQDISTHDEPTEDEKLQSRDDIFFTYLNFTYILIYSFLAGVILTRCFGDSTYIK